MTQSAACRQIRQSWRHTSSRANRRSAVNTGFHGYFPCDLHRSVRIKDDVKIDPACGSGNFLTETYLSLRRLENEVIALKIAADKKEIDGQILMGFENASPVQVSIQQFYGIEINDFAVTVAMTALFIAESQMLKETEAVVRQNIDYLPLKSYVNIVEGNALRLDWNEVVPKEKLNFIMGNPPFAGRRYRTISQTEDVSNFFSYKDIDYVACWFKKTSDWIKDTPIHCAFVATNSITQGEQVAALWKGLPVYIHFAHRTFRWDSEASEKAHVHCVIIGFADSPVSSPTIFDGDTALRVEHINGYLLDAPDIYVSISSKPSAGVPKMQNGNVPLDGNALKIEKEDAHLFNNCPHLLKRLIGGRELLHNEMRYVLWLVGISPAEIRKYPQVYQRVELCRQNRLAMKDKGTRKLADTPTTFRDTLNPDNYIALPMVSSERRRYLPMAYFHGDTIPTNQVQIIPNASIYDFGILESNVHMAWMRVICGRLKSDYRYSKDLVYNNFVWPDTTTEQRSRIERTAQAILDARDLYPDSSLSDLYDPTLMPQELLKAHRENDRAVMQAYGLNVKTTSESDCAAYLLKLY